MPVRQFPGSRGLSGRSSDLKAAVRLSILTITWNVVVGGAAILIAATIGSLSLAGFGLSAALDSIASAALVWRFGAEVKDSSRGHRLETVTVRIVGGTLIVVALYVAGQAARSLLSHSGPHVSTMAVLIAGLSLLVLPPLALGKLRLAGRLGSKALRGDGVLTAIGATLAALTLLGLVLDALLGWWWSDAAAALVMSGLLVREGVLTLSETD
jgi:divalent metal cation (Fe/Co/Zn/Cd) transporter